MTEETIRAESVYKVGKIEKNIVYGRCGYSIPNKDYKAINRKLIELSKKMSGQGLETTINLEIIQTEISKE